MNIIVYALLAYLITAVISYGVIAVIVGISKAMPTSD
ncbi:conserved protein of unknown function [Rhodovastum atsumiense]|nr:conserved protein of unknown function [Rhodovastum atsumiense]